MNKKIIVFSGKQYAGKDTVAAILLKKFTSFKRIGIADAIKLKYAKEKGITIAEIESNKSKYREDLIALGNWGRAQNADYWLNSIIAYEGNTIVTDIRMKHELELFRKHGAYTVRVEADEEVREQRGHLVSNNDATEIELDGISDWDFIITNNGSYSELEDNIRNLETAIISRFGEDI